MHPQSSGYYAPYQPAPFTGGSNGGGGFSLAGRSAWDTVEGLTGKDARRQLEKGVKTLAQSEFPNESGVLVLS